MVNDNNIEVIKKFNFLGFTILGSQRAPGGILTDVKEGIEGAHMLITDWFDNAPRFERNCKALAFAYNAYDKATNDNVKNPESIDKDSNNFSKKEEDTEVENEKTETISLEDDNTKRGGEGMETKFEEKIDVNSEPNPIDTDDKSMAEIVDEATKSISAPESKLPEGASEDNENITLTEEVSKGPDGQEAEVVGKGDSEKKEDIVEQPDDEAKLDVGRESAFESEKEEDMNLENNNFKVIRFWDNGFGIKKDDQKIIFDKFERASASNRMIKKGGASGFGMGLTYVFQVIDAHHGMVTVDSELGKYTEFTIFLPDQDASNGGVKKKD